MRIVPFVRLAALLAPLVGLSAMAQEVDWHRFYPLAEGDTWTYSFYERECPNTPDPCSPATERVVVRTVVGTVEVDGVTRPLVRAEERIAAGGPATCVADYAVWLDEATAQVRVVPQGTSCPHAYRTEPLGGDAILEEAADVDDGFREERTVTIGDAPYTLLTHSMTADIGLSEASFAFGLDVGLVDLWNTFSLSGSGFSTQTFYDLLYAEVGGVAYGTPPVASEGSAVPTAFALGALFPNPFRTTATLTLSLPAAEAMTMEAFDMLGRRVLEHDLGVQPAGTSRHTLDLGAAPAGVYFVRATTASGRSATRRAVRVE